MKTIRWIISVFLFSFAQHATAQFVTINDSNFLNCLINNGYAGCISGNQLNISCADTLPVSELDCSTKNIQNISGIEYLTPLRRAYFVNNLITSISNLPPNLIFLSLPYNNLTQVNNIPPGLESLFVHGNNFSYLDLNSVTSLKTLWAGENLLNENTFVLPDSVVSLHIDNNNFTSIDYLPNSIIELYCNNNIINKIYHLPDSLKMIDCQNNLIDSLNVLPPDLRTLICENNNIAHITNLPKTLTWLFCSGNNLTKIPDLDSIPLIFLRCSSQGYPVIDSTTFLPSTLIELITSYNSMNSLPALPGGLQYLDCSFNNLQELTMLPSALKTLICSNNNLDTLTIPQNLEALYCESSSLNQIISLSGILKKLYCKNNQLTSLPALRDTMDNLDISNNPGILCLPSIQKINYSFLWSNTGITCLPDYIQTPFNTVPSVSGVPLCDLFNANNCSFIWNISGQVYAETNANCINDIGDPKSGNIKVSLFENGNLIQQTYSNQRGNYTFDVPPGTYGVTADTLYNLVNCPGNGNYTVILTSTDSTENNLDFGISCAPVADVGIRSLSGIRGNFRPANIARVRINAGDLTDNNLNCTSGVSGLLQIIIDGPASYSGNNPGSSSPLVLGDTIIYQITDFDLINPNTSFDFNILTDTLAQIGDQICFDVTLNAAINDPDTLNNYNHYCFNVLNSFDPNDKQVSPIGVIDSTEQWLTYTIRFQNTGNAPAQHIYILDTLSFNVDESSFQLLSYSDEPIVQITGHNVRFNFPNINLPDSANDEPNSHGFVQYKVKTKPGLQDGTDIENTAYIYFDFNQPVVTNTTINTVDIVTSIQHQIGGSALNVYPNPFTSSIAVESSEPIFDIQIFDMTGRKVYSFNTNGRTKASADLTGMPDGLYIMVVNTATSMERLKIIKR